MFKEVIFRFSEVILQFSEVIFQLENLVQIVNIVKLSLKKEFVKIQTIFFILNIYIQLLQVIVKI